MLHAKANENVKASHKITSHKPTKEINFTGYLDNTVKYVSIVVAISAVYTEVFHSFGTPEIMQYKTNIQGSLCFLARP